MRGFTMRALAERARVDVVTLYNLIGSKQDILRLLMSENIQQFSQELGRSKADPLQMLFTAVSQLKTYYSREERYYRTALFEVYVNGGTDYPSLFRGPKWALWQDLVREAAERGYLSPDIDPDALSTHLASLLFAHILEWGAGDISLEEMEARTHYGFALSLQTAVNPPHKQKLRKLYLKAQTKLRRHHAK